MSYRIRFHDLANDDFRRIKTWISDYAGNDVAIRRLREIRTAIRGLQTFPNRGALRDDILPGLRLLPVGDEAVVLFVVDEPAREVLVLTVSYAGSDWISRSIARF